MCCELLRRERKCYLKRWTMTCPSMAVSWRARPGAWTWAPSSPRLRAAPTWAQKERRSQRSRRVPAVMLSPVVSPQPLPLVHVVNSTGCPRYHRCSHLQCRSSSLAALSFSEAQPLSALSFLRCSHHHGHRTSQSQTAAFVALAGLN